jgi:purine nucleosidase
MQFRKLPIIFVFAGVTRFAVAETVWIDTDVSIGSPIREVDDAYAIMLALHSPEIRIVGISTSYGNAALGHTTHAARELIQQFGAPANLKPDQVFAGARSAADLGQRSAASDALARVLENESLTYIALGPLTNLASFLRLHPEAARKIRRIIFLGGQPEGTTLAVGPHGSFPIHDANVFKDPQAVEALLASKIPLTLVPIATASDVLLNEEDLHELERHGFAGNYLSRRSKLWLWFWKNIVHAAGGPIFDALPIITVSRPDLVTLERRYARTDAAGNLWVTRGSRARGTAATGTSGLTSGSRAVRCCTSCAAGTKRFVMQRLVTRRRRD